MDYHRLHVDGMSCTGCEATIKSEIGSLGNVSGVEADHATGTLAFAASNVAAPRDVERTVERLGYEVAGRDPRSTEARSLIEGD